MKVWRLVFLVGVLLLLEALGAHADAWGDIDGDGTLTILDVRLCTQIAYELIPCPGNCAELDVTGDGTLDDDDCSLLSYMLLRSPPAPEINVQRPVGTRIHDGGTDAVGNYTPGTTTIDLRYTIENTSATALLRVLAVSASNLSNCSGFAVANGLPFVVPANESATLDVSFDVDGDGPFSLDLEIENNDPGQSRYDIHITGRRCHLVVSFDDPGLETAVRDAVGKPTELLYACDVEPLTSLDARNRGILDLTGIDQLIGLQTLNLYKNDIVDITPLAGLTGLQSLDLSTNAIFDITPLVGLTGLQSLDLRANAIVDITPLVGLTGLQWLKLSRNAIVDITPLAGLTGLQTLALNTNGIATIGALASLVNLRVLQLAENAFTTIDALAGLTGLEELGLGGNAIADFGPLASLIGLQFLELEDTGIADISALAGLVNLRTLYLPYNLISDISPLANLVKLMRLDLTGNLIAAIDALAGLTALEWLDLDHNQIEDIDALAGLTALEDLDLDDNDIVDIEALVANSVAGGLGAGDRVELRSNPLGAQACADVVTLRNNGVTVDEDACP